MMNRWLLLLVMAMLTAQAEPTFYVGEVEVLTAHDSRYVLRRANQIFSSDAPSRQRDVECLVAELKATGMYAEVRAQLTPSQKKNARNLLISTVDAERIQEFTISEVVLSGFPEVDAAEFQTALVSKGVTNGLPLLKYSFSELERRVSEALITIYPAPAAKKDGMGLAWVTIQPATADSVRLLVSPTLAGCGASEGVP